jgi:hypothetical protein
MFLLEGDHIVAAFLHPNYKQLRGATTNQIADCYHLCRCVLLPADPMEVEENNEEATVTDSIAEPRSKRPKLLITSLMDKNVPEKKRPSDEIDRYINLQLDPNVTYTNPLEFWQQSQHHQSFPNLSRLARQYFSIPCSSAAVERQFSAAGMIINQRRANMDPSTLNNVIFLRSVEKHNCKI